MRRAGASLSEARPILVCVNSHIAPQHEGGSVDDRSNGSREKISLHPRKHLRGRHLESLQHHRRGTPMTCPCAASTKRRNHGGYPTPICRHRSTCLGMQPQKVVEPLFQSSGREWNPCQYRLIPRQNAARVAFLQLTSNTTRYNLQLSSIMNHSALTFIEFGRFTCNPALSAHDSNFTISSRIREQTSMVKHGKEKIPGCSLVMKASFSLGVP